MRIHRIAIALVAALALAGASDLLAQRRSTGGGSSGGGSGGGSGERQTPSRGGGGSSTSGGQRGGSSGGSGSSTRRGGDDERREPSRGTSTTRGRESDRPSTDANTTRGSRASGGKIDNVRDRARAARARISTSRGVIVVGGIWVGDCWDCNYWGWRRGYWGWYHGGYWYPAHYPRYHRPEAEGDAEVTDEPLPRRFGQTYLEYPYADDEMSDASFIQQGVPGRRGYGALTMSGFGDHGSDTRAGRFTLEGGSGLFHGEVHYAQYAEPLTGGTDRMHVYRGAIGVQPRLGDQASLTASVGVRGVALQGGGHASGPEAGLALQLLPSRPLGINLNGRLASLSWTGEDRFTFQEYNATGSVFLGRVELQGGWHYMKIGDTPAFSGPMAGLKVWF